MRNLSKLYIVVVVSLLLMSCPWGWDDTKEQPSCYESTCHDTYFYLGYEVQIENIGTKLNATEPIWDQIEFFDGYWLGGTGGSTHFSYKSIEYTYSTDGLYWDNNWQGDKHAYHTNHYTITGLDIDSKTGKVKTASNGGTLRFFVSRNKSDEFFAQKDAEQHFYDESAGQYNALSSFGETSVGESFMVRINDAIYDGFQYVYYSGSGKGKTRTDLLYDGNGGKIKAYAAKPNTKIEFPKEKIVIEARKRDPNYKDYVRFIYAARNPYIVDATKQGIYVVYNSE